MLKRRQIVEQSLRRQEVERTSCFPLVDASFAAMFAGKRLGEVQLDPEVHARTLAQCLDGLAIDGVYVNLCFSREQAARAELHDGRFRVLVDDCLEVEFGPDDVASIARTHIASLEDPRVGEAQLFHPGMLQTYRALSEAAKEQAAVCVGLTGAFSQLAFLLGLEKLLLAMVDQPDAVHRALACRQEAALRQADEICRAGARFLWIGEGMASGSLISPAMYREFVLPYEQALVQHIRRRGSLSLLHICGNTSMMLAEIAQAGADGCDIDAPTDWAAAWEILGPRMCLKGNINPLLFLPEHIARLPAACEEARRVAAGRPGFILSTGCLVPPGAVPEAFNVMARGCGMGSGVDFGQLPEDGRRTRRLP